MVNILDAFEEFRRKRELERLQGKTRPKKAQRAPPWMVQNSGEKEAGQPPIGEARSWIY